MSLELGSDLVANQPTAGQAPADKKADPVAGIIRPTYDQGHYLRRAQTYTRAADHEPDPGIQAALRWCAHECRRRAEQLKGRY